MDLLFGVALVLGVMILCTSGDILLRREYSGYAFDVFSIGFGPRLFAGSASTDYR